MDLSLLLLAVVDVADVDGPAGNCAAQTLGERQRRAACGRRIDRLAIGLARLRRAPRRREGKPRMAKKFAVALEAYPHRHLHAHSGMVIIRWLPARAQRREQIADRVEIVIGLGVFAHLAALDG